jgi:hypothetical protein
LWFHTSNANLLFLVAMVDEPESNSSTTASTTANPVRLKLNPGVNTSSSSSEPTTTTTTAQTSSGPIKLRLVMPTAPPTE